MLGDKAYSNRAIRSALRRRRIRATVPEPADQVRNRAARGSRGGRPPGFDAEDYKRRNVVERAINKLRGYRAVATRYDSSCSPGCAGIPTPAPTSPGASPTARPAGKPSAA
jgi:transposase